MFDRARAHSRKGSQIDQLAIDVLEMRSADYQRTMKSVNVR